MTIPHKDEGITVQSARGCYLCGTEGQILYESLRDRLFECPGQWDLRKCPECGLLWLDPMPTEADIHKVYATYYTHQGYTGEITHVGIASVLRRKFRTALKPAYNLLLYPTGLHYARFKMATMHLADKKPGRLLEVGCGNGTFLDRMRSLGWNVQGVEVDPKATKIAQETFGVPVRVGTLEEANYPGGFFDAVTMNHVIEHVHDPIALLRECDRVLKPGGQLVVVTPNVMSFGHACFRRNWLHLDPPRHLCLFSQSTLEGIAKKASIRNIKTWTTHANAEGVAFGSFNIQFDGQHIMGSSPSPSRELMSKWFQLRALAYYRKRPDSGEEVILKASK